MEPIEPATPPDSVPWRVAHFPPVLLAIGIACTVAAIALSVLANKVIGRHEGDWWAVFSSTVTAGFFVIMYSAFGRWIERRPVSDLSGRGWALELGGGIVTGLAIFSAIIGVIALLGGYQVVGTRGPHVLVPALAVAIISGFTEEIFFRGLFFRILERWLGSWAALALSAALFGGLHLGNPNATWLAAVGIAFEAGILLAAIYMITRQLWAAIGLHAAWNFAEGGIYGVPISGGTFDGLLVPRIGHSDLLTGGAFGPEASLPAMIVATACGVALLAVAYRRGRFVQPSWIRRSGSQPAALQA
jgi:membrane protease YdiL (CAAX protease family)